MTQKWKYGKQEVEFDEENGVTIVRCNGEMTAEEMTKLVERVAILLLDEKKPPLVIICTNKTVHVSRGAREAMRMWGKKIMSDSRVKANVMEKLAFVNMPMAHRIVAGMMIRLFATGELKFFDSFDDALAWMKEG